MNPEKEKEFSIDFSKELQKFQKIARIFGAVVLLLGVCVVAVFIFCLMTGF